MENSYILLVNQNCSAGCLHCPYSSMAEQPPKDVDMIINEFNNANSRLVILSGGEPMEYLFLKVLLERIASLKKPFRIATGGHISFKPYLSLLIEISHFTGFSIGTDILIPKRNSNNAMFRQWTENLNDILENEIHHSFTITLGEECDFRSTLQILFNLKSSPDFLMLSEKDGELLSEVAWEKYISIAQTVFPDTRITFGFRN